MRKPRVVIRDGARIKLDERSTAEDLEKQGASAERAQALLRQRDSHLLANLVHQPDWEALLSVYLDWFNNGGKEDPSRILDPNVMYFLDSFVIGMTNDPNFYETVVADLRELMMPEPESPPGTTNG